MTIEERSEILSGLYKLRGELFALNRVCAASQALSVAVAVSKSQELITEQIDEMSGRNDIPATMEFPCRKN